MTALKRSLVPPEREGHGDRIVVEARAITSTGHVVEHGARVVSPVERYLKRGQLTGRQGNAAERLYRAWATGVAGAKLQAPGCVSYSPSGWADAQIQARRVYEASRAAVGPRLWPIVFHCCCMDWPVDRIANELLKGANPTSTMALFRHAMDEVADAMDLPE
jgi:hypothetical protein